MRRVLLVLVAAAACIGPDASRCQGGLACPAGQVCVEAAQVCASPKQRDVCEDEGDGSPCAFEGNLGECLTGVCRPYLCGNGVVEPGETCDGTRTESCIDLDFDRGFATCDPIGCTTNITGCAHIGFVEQDVVANAEFVDIDMTSSGFAMAVGPGANQPVFAQRKSGTWSRLESSMGPLGAVFTQRIVVASETEAYASGVAAGYDSGEANLRTLLFVWDGSSWVAEDMPVLGNALALSPAGWLLACSAAGECALRDPGGEWGPTSMAPIGGEAENLSDAVWVDDDTAYAVHGRGILSDSVILRYRRTSEPAWDPAPYFEPPSDGFQWRLRAIHRVGDATFAIGNKINSELGERPLLLKLVGSTWTEVAVDIDQSPTLRDIHVVDADNLWIAGSDDAGGVVIRVRNGNWLILHEANDPVRRLAAASPVDCAGLTIGELIQSTDQFWAAGDTDRPVADLVSLSETETYAGWFSFLGGGVLEPSGLGFAERFPTTILQPLGPTAMWARSADEVFTISINNLYQLVLDTPPESQPMQCIADSDGDADCAETGLMRDVAGSSDQLYTAGNDGTFTRYDADGTNPVDLPTPISTDLYAVWADEAGAVAVGDAGVVLRYQKDTGTVTWLPYTGSDLRAVWGTSIDDFYVAGSSPALFHYQGDTMTPVDLPLRRNEVAPELLLGISGTGADDVFVVGDFGTIYHYDGSRWSQIRSPAASLRGVVATSEVVYFFGPTNLHRLIRTPRP